MVQCGLVRAGTRAFFNLSVTDNTLTCAQCVSIGQRTWGQPAIQVITLVLGRTHERWIIPKRAVGYLFPSMTKRWRLTYIHVRAVAFLHERHHSYATHIIYWRCHEDWLHLHDSFSHLYLVGSSIKMVHEDRENTFSTITNLAPRWCRDSKRRATTGSIYDRTSYWLYLGFPHYCSDSMVVLYVFPLYSGYIVLDYHRLGSTNRITDLIGAAEQCDLRHMSIKLTAPQIGSFLGGIQLYVCWMDPQ